MSATETIPLTAAQDQAGQALCRSFLMTAMLSGADYAAEYGALVALVVGICQRAGGDRDARAMARAFAETVEQELVFAGPIAGSA